MTMICDRIRYLRDMNSASVADLLDAIVAEPDDLRLPDNQFLDTLSAKLISDVFSRDDDAAYAETMSAFLATMRERKVAGRVMMDILQCIHGRMNGGSVLIGKSGADVLIKKVANMCCFGAYNPQVMASNLLDILSNELQHGTHAEIVAGFLFRYSDIHDIWEHTPHGKAMNLSLARMKSAGSEEDWNNAYRAFQYIIDITKDQSLLHHAYILIASEIFIFDDILDAGHVAGLEKLLDACGKRILPNVSVSVASLYVEFTQKLTQRLHDDLICHQTFDDGMKRIRILHNCHVSFSFINDLIERMENTKPASMDSFERMACAEYAFEFLNGQKKIEFLRLVQ